MALFSGYAGVVTEEVENEPPSAAELVATIHAELLARRKTPEGLSPLSIADCPALLGLVGGDPQVAFTRLEQRILHELSVEEDELPLIAASYSLGFASKELTHLARLDDFGTAYGFEARQSRRHSDRGVRQIAHLIATNWLVHQSPQLRISVAQSGACEIAVGVMARRPWLVDMRAVEIYLGSVAKPAVSLVEASCWRASEESDDSEVGLWHVQMLANPIQVSLEALATSALVVRWKGSVWPTIHARFIPVSGELGQCSVEVLGNTAVIDVTPNSVPKGKTSKQSR